MFAGQESSAALSSPRAYADAPSRSQRQSLLLFTWIPHTRMHTCVKHVYSIHLTSQATQVSYGYSSLADEIMAYRVVCPRFHMTWTLY